MPNPAWQAAPRSTPGTPGLAARLAPRHRQPAPGRTPPRQPHPGSPRTPGRRRADQHHPHRTRAQLPAPGPPPARRARPRYRPRAAHARRAPARRLLPAGPRGARPRGRVGASRRAARYGPVHPTVARQVRVREAGVDRDDAVADGHRAGDQPGTGPAVAHLRHPGGGVAARAGGGTEAPHPRRVGRSLRPVSPWDASQHQAPNLTSAVLPQEGADRVHLRPRRAGVVDKEDPLAAGIAM